MSFFILLSPFHSSLSVQYHFGLLLDRVRHLDGRGHLSNHTGEFVETPLQSLFVPSTSVAHTSKLSPLEKSNLLEGHQLEETVLDSDVMIIADEAPSWARQSVDLNFMINLISI